jgi:MFS transporter, ACS family, hexuronate transporter
VSRLRSRQRPLPHLRWYIGGLLFLVTVINYVDRQVFSILAPDLQRTIGWSELDYGRMVMAFQVSYGVSMMVVGRVLDRVGTRVGLAVAVLAWSLVSALHAVAQTPLGFGLARFAMGITEAANFPAAVKVVAEWFPASERPPATGLFNSGVALGAVVASVAVPLLAAAYGWQAAFILTAAAGLLWLPLWWWLYDSVPRHPRLAPDERAMIDEGRDTVASHDAPPSWWSLLGYRQTWAYGVTKLIADPVWWFYLFWLPKFLADRHGLRGVDVIPYLTAVYVAADIGCLAGGWVSGVLVKRGWGVNLARKVTMGGLAIVMAPTVMVAGFASETWVAVALIAVACGCHQAWSTLVFTVASDLFPSRAAGSVAGIGGFVAGMSSLVAAEAIGRLLNQDPGAYRVIFMAAGLAYPAGLLALHLLSPRMEPAVLSGGRATSGCRSAWTDRP